MDLEQQILNSIQGSVGKAIQESLSGYNSPLMKLISEVINNHKAELRERYEFAITAAIDSQQFREAVNEAFQHKLAKTVVANFSGSVDKAFNELKNEPTFKAKAILAIENILTEMSKTNVKK